MRLVVSFSKWIHFQDQSKGRVLICAQSEIFCHLKKGLSTSIKIDLQLNMHNRIFNTTYIMYWIPQFH